MSLSGLYAAEWGSVKESNKLLWQDFQFCISQEESPQGETDCRLFCVRRGNGGRLVVAFRLMHLPALQNAFESASAM